MKAIPKFHEQPCPTCGTERAVVDGAWLRQQRTAARQTLRGLADSLGYSAAYLCDVEHNRRNCSPVIRAAYEAL